MGSHLHIVSFNVPWPADYGGVIDVFYRIVALAKAGVKVHLHCYTYGREEADELNQYCEEVCYYPREVGWKHQLNKKPYIVSSRNSQKLIHRLSKDNYPILLEGLHNGYVLEELADRDRLIIVRTHNVEHDYYHALSKAKGWGREKLFFGIEAWRLKQYEPVLKQANAILAISEADAAHFRSVGCKNVHVMPPSHGHDRVSSCLGKGDYVLYHGNLSVVENVQAVDYLAQHVLGETPYQFMIAGRNPSASMVKRLTQFSNVTLVANPTDAEMHDLIANAHVNLLITQQATGVKLKLMNALYSGRFCLVNAQMVAGTGLEHACEVAANHDEIIEKLNWLMNEEFGEEDLMKRVKLLSNTNAIEPLLALLATGRR
ncbi:MAG: glycosyltransferase [Bacteroidales bacterium]|nr:glycosyltransferase [Bacteroidales bacterium]